MDPLTGKHGQAQYLIFHLEDESYALSVLRVMEIIQYDTVTKVPKTPGWIRGVMNLRGIVLPVADLAVKFGSAQRPITRTTCVVVVEAEREGEVIAMGILADGVDQVVDLTAEDIAPPPEFGTRVRVDFLRGMARVGKQFALILDIDRLFPEDDQPAPEAPREPSAPETERPGRSAGVRP